MLGIRVFQSLTTSPTCSKEVPATDNVALCDWPQTLIEFVFFGSPRDPSDVESRGQAPHYGVAFPPLGPPAREYNGRTLGRSKARTKARLLPHGSPTGPLLTHLRFMTQPFSANAGSLRPLGNVHTFALCSYFVPFSVVLQDYHVVVGVDQQERLANSVNSPRSVHILHGVFSGIVNDFRAATDRLALQIDFANLALLKYSLACPTRPRVTEFDTSSFTHSWESYFSLLGSYQTEGSVPSQALSHALCRLSLILRICDAGSG